MLLVLFVGLLCVGVCSGGKRKEAYKAAKREAKALRKNKMNRESRKKYGSGSKKYSHNSVPGRGKGR